jgi:hypothetical protein
MQSVFCGHTLCDRGSRRTSRGHQLHHVLDTSSPRIDAATLVEDARDQRIPGQRLMRTEQVLDGQG